MSKMFKDAMGAKQRDLRVRQDNPAMSIAPPEQGERKAKVYLYPSEFKKLIACEDVARPFRVVYAVAVYTYMRAGELEATKSGELFADNNSQKHITFHDLRTTGITWMAVRGDDPLRIKRRAGHASFSTTEIYIREAENLTAGFGDVFPPLVVDLG